MPNVLVETLAQSTAHGISRAAATQIVPLRVAWILFFLIFLGLFCYFGNTLLDKLLTVGMVTTSEIDKVSFQFPDIYLCPSTALSGSYPYSLNRSDAALVNREIARFGELYDSMASRVSEKSNKVQMILSSLSPVVRNLLFQRPEQSVKASGSGGKYYNVTSVLVENELCFKINITDEDRLFLQSEVGQTSAIHITLLIDSYNRRFNFSGYKIDPIFDQAKNQTVDLTLWDIGFGIQDSFVFAGYTLLMVPAGAFPSKRFETGMQLAPGFAYEVAISMEQARFSEDLYDKNCSPSEPDLAFLEPLSGERVNYKPSIAGCYFDRRSRGWFSKLNVTMSAEPTPWDLRFSPKWGNLSEMLRIRDAVAVKQNMTDSESFIQSRIMIEGCKARRPCIQPMYKASFSFQKWPKLVSKFSSVSMAKLLPEGDLPAIRQIIQIAQHLESGNGSTMTEAEFLSFLSDSLLQVRIKAQSAWSTRLLIANSYTITAFLSDIGGLLGLYIGCSLLTLCELLELLYHAVTLAVAKWSRREKVNCNQELVVAAAS